MKGRKKLSHDCGREGKLKNLILLFVFGAIIIVTGCTSTRIVAVGSTHARQEKVVYVVVKEDPSVSKVRAIGREDADCSLRWLEACNAYRHENSRSTVWECWILLGPRDTDYSSGKKCGEGGRIQWYTPRYR